MTRRMLMEWSKSRDAYSVIVMSKVISMVIKVCFSFCRIE